MKVSELIKELEKLPGEGRVVVVRPREQGLGGDDVETLIGDVSQATMVIVVEGGEGGEGDGLDD